MSCSRMELLKPPVTIIFASLLCIATGIALACNSAVFIVAIIMKKRSSSTFIYFSLTLSDFFVALLVGPISIWQMLGSATLRNCVLDIIRSYISVLFVGSSVLILTVISYDRYLILTSPHNYNQRMSKSKALFLIGICWIVPALIPIVRQVNSKAYMMIIFFLFSSPLLTIGIFYLRIMKIVRKNAKILMRREKDVNQPISKAMALKISAPSGLRKDHSDPQHKHLADLKMAKSSTFLIACYVVCILPLFAWIILEFNTVYSNLTHQVIYLIAIFLLEVNSILNTALFLIKQEDFKKYLCRLYKRKSDPRL